MVWEDGEGDAFHEGAVPESAHGPGPSSDLPEASFDGICDLHRLPPVGRGIPEAGEEVIRVVAQAFDSFRIGILPPVGEPACGGAQRRSDAQPFERIRQCEPFHDPQSGRLHPDRAGAEHFQGVDVDLLEVGAPVRRRRGGADAPPGEQRGGDALRVRLQLRGDVGGRGQLAGEDFVDAPAKRRPLALYDIKVPFEIGQDALASLAADAFGAHEAEGKIPAIGAGTSASDEHGPKVAGCVVRCNHKIYFMALHSCPRLWIKNLQAKIREIRTNPSPISALGGKDGLTRQMVELYRPLPRHQRPAGRCRLTGP